jgi:hypothetical protein
MNEQIPFEVAKNISHTLLIDRDFLHIIVQQRAIIFRKSIDDFLTISADQPHTIFVPTHFRSAPSTAMV